MAVTKKLRYSLDEDQHLAHWEAGVDAEYEDAPPVDFEDLVDGESELPVDPEYDDSGQVEYELPVDPDYDDPLGEESGEELVGVGELVEAEAEVVHAPSAFQSRAAGFTYELGRTVLPVTQQQAHPVIWRGYLKERHPVTGLVYRVPVYQLADGYWDCYREEELQAA